MLKLEDIHVEDRVDGIEPDTPVVILHVKAAGPDAVNVAYERPNGGLQKKTLFRADEAQLSRAKSASQFTFTAKPEDFKIAAEAQRIRLAHLFDPMMAVHTSNVDPLPHQIAAVYESLLPRQPLRYVLADDPGAGKTIMAGLFIKELILRGDLERCLIVCPGSLVEQWQSELNEKFGLRFDILTHALFESTQSGNAFREHPLLIARLDQLTRNDVWRDKLQAEDATWDLVVFDEAHKCAAHAYGAEIKTTKRYDLAKLIGHPDRTRHLLLMTATPHNGKDDDFNAWLGLVDEDRFIPAGRAGATSPDVSDLMRRMVKEDLVKFDGKPLFPDRIAETAKYALSANERRLYDDVTSYVREQMGKADAILDGKKRAVVGFALTILQRRLASSPYAIKRSLERRREKLENKLTELRAAKQPKVAKHDPFFDIDFDPTDVDDDDDLEAEKLEAIEEIVVDEATTAMSLDELEREIEELKLLEKQAIAVLHSKVDTKWDQLSSILQKDTAEMSYPDGRRRKMIIFTEHKDTLDYLRHKITDVLGSDKAVIEIHGGTHREARLQAQEAFRQDKDVLVLVATDAAGEGVNLQVANLMVNYDLPWNPNRIEQRFGRIHRIGQREICRLWNLVATDTREGEVFDRLFTKLNDARATLQGKVFDVLGQTFDETPLKDLLIRAIRHGEDPEVRAKLFQVVDGALNVDHCRQILKRNALTPDAFNQARLESVREQMEKAEAKKLQPFYLRRFLVEAFKPYGGELLEREAGRYEVRHVPAGIRHHHKQQGNRIPVLEKYERITFDRTLIDSDSGKPKADLVHPAHPLMSAVLDLTLKDRLASLHQGTTLFDPLDPGTRPRIVFLIDHVVREGTSVPRDASRRLHFVEIDEDGHAKDAGSAPYLNFAAPSAGEEPLIQQVKQTPWLQRDLRDLAVSWATQHLVEEHLTEVKKHRENVVKKTLHAVHERLTREINYWSKRKNELDAQVKAGKQPKIQPENAKKRAEELKARLKTRTADLESMLHVSSNPPVVLGCALVIPQGLVDQFHDRPSSLPEFGASDAEARKKVEMIAMKAVMDAESALGHRVKDVSKEKIGWDVWSTTKDGVDRMIEVKGRHIDAETITVTANEVLMGLNKGEKFMLAIVRVDGATVDGPHYVRQPFMKEPDPGAASVNYVVKDLLKRAKKAGEV